MNQDIYNYGKEIKFTNLQSGEEVSQSFKECLLDGCSFKNRQPMVDVRESLFLNSDLSNCNFQKSYFHHVNFINCKFNKSNFHKAKLYYVNFINCSGLVYYNIQTRTRSTTILLNPINNAPILYDSKEGVQEFYGNEIKKIKDKYLKSFIETVKINSPTFRKSLEM